MDQTDMNIPLLRPRLPTFDALRPYIERIDAARIYSNRGPLVSDLEERLAARMSLPAGGVASAANATLALTAALAAQSPRPGSLCLMPAWTFVASPLAAIAAGLVPCFVDVAARDWLMHPQAVADLAGVTQDDIGAAMPVAAFGQPIDIAAWDRFRDATGVAVVVDSAAGFDAATGGGVPNVVSLHATKALGAGEGGFVASHDTALIRKIRSHLSFGFEGGREALVRGVNGKMSEYHAAVGLAALDDWDATRTKLMRQADLYADAFASSQFVRLQPGFGKDWVSATLVVEFSSPCAEAVERSLAAVSIETRHWWGAGAHLHASMSGFPRHRLEVTERLAGATLGLPFHQDLTAEQIDEVVAEVLAARMSR